MKHITGRSYPEGIRRCITECTADFFKIGGKYYFRDNIGEPLYEIGNRDDFTDYLRINCSRFYVQGFANNGWLFFERGFFDDFEKAKRECIKRNKNAKNGDVFKVYDMEKCEFIFC
jgi:hypothetical protein